MMMVADCPAIEGIETKCDLAQRQPDDRVADSPVIEGIETLAILSLSSCFIVADCPAIEGIETYDV